MCIPSMLKSVGLTWVLFVQIILQVLEVVMEYRPTAWIRSGLKTLINYLQYTLEQIDR